MDIHKEKKTRKSVCAALIVKNEEKNLERCLKSIEGWVDEIIILDSGSTDNTEIIARKFTDKFYTNTQWEGFGKQRQRAQQFVSCEYVLWIDADEIVTEELRDSILMALKSSTIDTGYKLNRLSSAFGKYIRHSGWSPDWLVRLYPNHMTQYNDALVHEKVIVPDNMAIEPLNGYLLHNTYDNLHHYIEKTTKYIKAWSDEREGKKHPKLATALIHAFSIFIKMYIIRLGFLDGRHGFILAWLSMHSTFIKYIDLFLRDYNGEVK